MRRLHLFELEDLDWVPRVIPGVRTVSGALHHFPPGAVRELIAGIVARGEPLASPAQVSARYPGTRRGILSRMTLRACPVCDRHIRAEETGCPFCGSPSSARAPDPPDVAASRDEMITLYGAPPPPAVFREDMALLYGAPPPPPSTSRYETAPLYGAPPPPTAWERSSGSTRAKLVVGGATLLVVVLGGLIYAILGR